VLIAVSSEETIINIMPVGIAALSEETTCVRGTGRGSRGFRKPLENLILLSLHAAETSRNLTQAL